MHFFFPLLPTPPQFGADLSHGTDYCYFNSASLTGILQNNDYMSTLCDGFTSRGLEYDICTYNMFT